jgi:hypothetical protein
MLKNIESAGEDTKRRISAATSRIAAAIVRILRYGARTAALAQSRLAKSAQRLTEES